jgi:Sec7-like guanine-nucleotide exchange factor
LFTDILVIAKPLSDDPTGPMLDGLFAVKSVVGLSSLALFTSASEEIAVPDSADRHPVVTQFIETFARDPSVAIKLLYERSQLQGDSATLASLLFKTPELDKEQLGEYLARRENLPLLRAFVDRFHFQGVRLDEALRMFLLSLRLPVSTVACEAVLHALAERWVAANRSAVTFDVGLAADLVLAMMQVGALYCMTPGYVADAYRP